MATFKIVVQKKRRDGFYLVYIRLTHNRQVCYIKTDKLVNDKGLVSGTKEIKDTFVLTSLMGKINNWITMLNHVNIEHWTLKQVKEYLERGDESVNFSDFAREYIESLHGKVVVKTMLSYNMALKNLEKFADSNKIMFSQLTINFVQKWIQSLLNKRAAKFTYPTLIKKIFNEGLKQFNDYDNNILRIKNNPWMNVEIPKIEVAEKKAITMEECRRFFAIQPRSDGMRMTMDICKMVLCLAGMNVVDIYNLKKTDYYDGILHYERQKTKGRRKDNAYMEMRVPDMLLETFRRYFSDAKDPYLFNFHKSKTISSVHTHLHLYLKEICKDILGMKGEKQYTPYTFRHTWATIAQNDIGAMYEEIAFAMNHNSAHKVTMDYIKTDYSPAWYLNEKVVEKIFFTNEKSKTRQKKMFVTFGDIDELYELKAEAYYMGDIVGYCHGKGYLAIDEIIAQLMASLDEKLPRHCTIQIKITNVTKNQTKYLERTR